MKDFLKDYFPDRFDDGETKSGLLKKVFGPLQLSINESSKFKCESGVMKVAEQSNEIKLLIGAMKKYGCNFSLLRHVVCESCKNCAGGFDPDTRQIVMCHNVHYTKNMIMATLMHEMIHMFDYCRAKFDFNNLEHVACSEIRAANLSYCSIIDRLTHGGPGMFDFKKTHQYCVKDVAFRSVKSYSPETEDEKIWDVIDKVFPGCYNDLEPFGRRPVYGGQDFRQSYRERFYYGYN